jgi:hypothetical protein
MFSDFRKQKYFRLASLTWCRSRHVRCFARRVAAATPPINPETASWARPGPLNAIECFSEDWLQPSRSLLLWLSKARPDLFSHTATGLD